jgi:hypothetical protein
MTGAGGSDATLYIRAGLGRGTCETDGDVTGLRSDGVSGPFITKPGVRATDSLRLALGDWLEAVKSELLGGRA